MLGAVVRVVDVFAAIRRNDFRIDVRVARRDIAFELDAARLVLFARLERLDLLFLDPLFRDQVSAVSQHVAVHRIHADESALGVIIRGHVLDLDFALHLAEQQRDALTFIIFVENQVATQVSTNQGLRGAVTADLEIVLTLNRVVAHDINRRKRLTIK